MNKFLNYHQNCYKPKISAYFGTNMIAWGCIWLFLVKIAEGKSLCTSHMVYQHDSVLRDLWVFCLWCRHVTEQPCLQACHSHIQTTLYKLTN